MPNPTHRHSKARTAKRRTHYKAKAAATSTCDNCGETKLQHRVCPNCGHYAGREIIEIERRARASAQKRGKGEELEGVMESEVAREVSPLNLSCRLRKQVPP